MPYEGQPSVQPRRRTCSTLYRILVACIQPKVYKRDSLYTKWIEPMHTAGTFLSIETKSYRSFTTVMESWTSRMLRLNLFAARDFAITYQVLPRVHCSPQ